MCEAQVRLAPGPAGCERWGTRRGPGRGCAWRATLSLTRVRVAGRKATRSLWTPKKRVVAREDVDRNDPPTTPAWLARFGQRSEVKLVDLDLRTPEGWFSAHSWASQQGCWGRGLDPGRRCGC